MCATPSGIIFIGLLERLLHHIEDGLLPPVAPILPEKTTLTTMIIHLKISRRCPIEAPVWSERNEGYKWQSMRVNLCYRPVNS